ncbi:MAG: hypothetical protein M3R04_00225 [bacterium]|nr:hypothetical protein [bacterium]
MYRLLALLLCAVAMSACPAKSETDGKLAAQSHATATASANPTVVLLLSGSTQSQWDSELLASIGAQLGFAPYEKQETRGHLDLLGPYEVKLGDTAVRLAICMLGLDSLSGLQAQTDVGLEAREWLDAQQPKVAWLDGDRAQFFVGRTLVATTPVVFSGVVSDRQSYYTQNATGVYERPALPALLKLIWERAPKAKNFALLSDAAPVSRGSVAKFHELLTFALQGDGKALALEPAQDWAMLHERLLQAQKEADAVIIAGIGEEQGGEAFQPPCPEGLLKGVTIPVIAVGSNDAATCFPVTVRLRASAHARLALGMCGQVLDGVDPGGIPTVTPEEMQVTVNEK